MHPYVKAMLHVLYENGARSSRPALMQSIVSLVSPSADISKDFSLMRQTAQEIIEHRRHNPKQEADFLNTLLYAKDPKTGEAMRDELIAANMTTFLVAGHETTSGLLSFATLCLLQNPEAYRKAQAEVDGVIGSATISADHLHKLKYIEGVLRETARLYPTAPGIGKGINPSQSGQVMLLDGRYKVEPEDRILVLLSRCMQDPKIFGEDAKDFKPERMTDDNPDWPLYQQSWRPFGNGSRACIGRSFALQEATLALAMMLQNFDLKLEDSSYQLRIKQTLTIKPDKLYVRASLRSGLTATELDRRIHSGIAKSKTNVTQASSDRPASTAAEGEMTILYGSNTGTCQALASKLASEASSYGIKAAVHPMDNLTGRIPTKSPTVIITASYEGEPPDNASHFIEWMQHLEGQELEGVKYAVFGCGHSDWRTTFHRIPKLVNDTFTKHGAERISNLGTTDCAKSSPTGDFETWCDDTLWPTLRKYHKGSDADVAPALDVEISTHGRAEALHHDVQVATVKDVRLLTTQGEPGKYHLDIELPPGSSYECGDYLAILPQNPESVVREIMAHFNLPADALITLKSPAFAPLPVNAPISVYDLLRNYVELSQPATKRAISTLSKYAADKSLQTRLMDLTQNNGNFEKEVSEPRLSIFNLLSSHPEINLPFAMFLTLLLPLSVRQYSISSSPLSSPTTATITYGILSSTTSKRNPPGSSLVSTDHQHQFHGVASTYLASLSPSDKIQVSVRRTAKSTFRLPHDPSTPLLMFCAGTGLAPFRGFVQQRVVQMENNPRIKLAPAVLFIGCRSQTRDRLYADELDGWVEKGAASIKYAFSQEPEKSKGCKYVADLMEKERELIVETWRAGARVYLCGSRDFADSVRAATEKMVEELMEERLKRGDEVGDEFRGELDRQLRERAASDIFD